MDTSSYTNLVFWDIFLKYLCTLCTDNVLGTYRSLWYKLHIKPQPWWQPFWTITTVYLHTFTIVPCSNALQQFYSNDYNIVNYIIELMPDYCDISIFLRLAQLSCRKSQCQDHLSTSLPVSLESTPSINTIHKLRHSTLYCAL